MKTPKNNTPETNLPKINTQKINTGKTLEGSSQLTHQASRILKQVAAKHRVTVEDIKGEAGPNTSSMPAQTASPAYAASSAIPIPK